MLPAHSSEPDDLRMSCTEDLLSSLWQLQSHFTWDLMVDLDSFSTQLEQDAELQAPAYSYSFKAYVRYLQGQPEEAESLLSKSEERIRELYGDKCELHLIVLYGDLAWLKYHGGAHTESQSYGQRVQDILLKHPVDSSTDLHPEVYGEKGWTYLGLSKSYYQKAIDCFQKALELQPDNCDWTRGYAVAFYRTEEDITQTKTEESPATKHLRRALQTNPEDGVLLCMLALKLVYYQKHQEAQCLVERALEVGLDHPKVKRYVAKYLRKQNQLDESIDLLQRALKSTQGQAAFIHHQLGLCYKRKMVNLLPLKPRSEEEVQHWRGLTIQHLEEALRMKSTLYHAKVVLALAYAEENAKGRAQEMFNEVLEKVEEEPQGMRQFIYRYYAEFCHYHIIQKDLAITYYTKAVEISITTSEGRHCMKKLRLIAERRLCNYPGDSVAYSILGTLAKAEGEQRTALKYYQRALQRDADNEEYLSALRELQLGQQ